MLTYLDPALVNIANNWESSDSLLRNYVFAADGSPCGELVEK